MLRSVALLLVPVLAFVGYQTLLRDEPDPLPPVDYASAAAAARAEAPFDVLVPVALPEGWRATSVRYTAAPMAQWHLGVLTEQNEYVGLEQITDSIDNAVATFAPGSSAAGTTMLAGSRWDVLISDGRVTLVRQAGNLTTLVTGTAPQEVLSGYVESLRAS